MNKSKVGTTILIIGRQGSGKTPEAKRLAAPFKNRLVYDRRREYDADEFTCVFSLEEFKELATETKGAAVIVEEATGFISFMRDIEVTDWVIGCEHNNNAVILLFHSIGDTPPYLLRLCRFIILLPTNDRKEVIERGARSFLAPHMGEGKKIIDGNKLW